MVVVILATLLIISNTYFAYLFGQASIAYVLGYVFLLPAIGILFSKNWRARWNAVLFTSFIIFLSVLGQLISIAGEIAKQGQT